MKLIIINGPNLNLTGKRETHIYGDKNLDDYLSELETKYPDAEITVYQSNVEGEIINKIQETGFSYDGIIINPGGYTHTSLAIADAIAAVETPVVEVHISNIYSREPERRVSLTGKHCVGIITGFGLRSYQLALNYFLNE